MAKNPLGTLWPSKTLNLREARLGQPGADVPKLPKQPKVKTPKVKMALGSNKVSRLKGFSAL